MVAGFTGLGGKIAANARKSILPQEDIDEHFFRMENNSAKAMPEGGSISILPTFGAAILALQRLSRTASLISPGY